jgi:hypothetical protein
VIAFFTMTWIQHFWAHDDTTWLGFVFNGMAKATV